jgi:hypothetical protein
VEGAGICIAENRKLKTENGTQGVRSQKPEVRSEDGEKTENRKLNPTLARESRAGEQVTVEGSRHLLKTEN